MKSMRTYAKATASVDFSFLLSKAQAGGNTLGRHLIQSFSPDETTAEQAHEIGKRLAEKHLKGEYAVVATHVDRNHIHNHFVWCAVNLKTLNRYHSNKRSYHEIQDLSDTICREDGLSVIEVKSAISVAKAALSIISSKRINPFSIITGLSL